MILEYGELISVEKILAEKAIANFTEGYNCSESMLRAYLEVYGKDIKLSCAASGFGGGIGGRGGTCGAVTGSIMAMGIHFNRQSPQETEIYGKVRGNSLAFQAKFFQEIGALHCKELVPYDLTTMEGRNKLHDDQEAMKKCQHFLTTAAKLLGEFLE
ncbi:MAG: C-GCAxxG-C-C family (seleno)protein [Peptococcaceae bacterium]